MTLGNRAARAKAVNGGGDGASIGGETDVNRICLPLCSGAGEDSVDTSRGYAEQNPCFQFLEPRKMDCRLESAAATAVFGIGIPLWGWQLMVR